MPTRVDIIQSKSLKQVTKIQKQFGTLTQRKKNQYRKLTHTAVVSAAGGSLVYYAAASANFFNDAFSIQEAPIIAALFALPVLIATGLDDLCGEKKTLVGGGTGAAVGAGLASANSFNTSNSIAWLGVSAIDFGTLAASTLAGLILGSFASRKLQKKIIHVCGQSIPCDAKFCTACGRLVAPDIRFKPADRINLLEALIIVDQMLAYPVPKGMCFLQNSVIITYGFGDESPNDRRWVAAQVFNQVDDEKTENKFHNKWKLFNSTCDINYEQASTADILSAWSLWNIAYKEREQKAKKHTKYTT